MKVDRTPNGIAKNISKRMKLSGAAVADAEAPLPLKITKADVRQGALKNATSCAAARALCNAGFTEARVHVARTYVKTKKGNWLRYSTPPALRAEIIAFDRGGTFEPGEYQLSPLQPSERVEARAKMGGRGRKYRKTKEDRIDRPKRKNHVTTGIRSRFVPD